MSLARRRFATSLLGAFAAVAFTLAIVGVYGVVAYGVATRQREFGVRVALGAEPRQVVALVLRQSLRTTAIGLAAGILGALAVTRLLGTLLYGVQPLDPATFGLTSLTLLIAALVACYVPGRRAATADPARVLRSE
jgi:putative ABC transport system permease protein